MELSWLQSVLYGFLSGLMDILPVSAQAHNMLLLKIFGVKYSEGLMDLLIQLAVLIALYFSCQTQLIRMSRAKRLSMIPKKKRKRPLDIHSLMDLKLLQTTLIPVILGAFAWSYGDKFRGNLVVTALFLLVNGLILYIPQFLPTGNRDSRTLSRVDGLLMGLGGIAAPFAGISPMGVSLSLSSVLGVDRIYGLSVALMMNLFVTVVRIIQNMLDLVSTGIGTLSAALLLRYAVTAICAFGGTLLGIRAMKGLSENQGYSVFGLYCLGLALFTFILNLIA